MQSNHFSLKISFHLGRDLVVLEIVQVRVDAPHVQDADIALHCVCVRLENQNQNQNQTNQDLVWVVCV